MRILQKPRLMISKCWQIVGLKITILHLQFDFFPIHDGIDVRYADVLTRTNI